MYYVINILHNTTEKFLTAESVGTYMLGKFLSNYVIVKIAGADAKAYVAKNFDVTTIIKELNEL